MILRIKQKPKQDPMMSVLWFAWYPVRVTPEHVVWLERVLRSVGARGKWIYRFTAKQIEKHKLAPF